jgi:hypothetical protein
LLGLNVRRVGGFAESVQEAPVEQDGGRRHGVSAANDAVALR